MGATWAKRCEVYPWPRVVDLRYSIPPVKGTSGQSFGGDEKMLFWASFLAGGSYGSSRSSWFHGRFIALVLLEAIVSFSYRGHKR